VADAAHDDPEIEREEDDNIGDYQCPETQTQHQFVVDAVGECAQRIPSVRFFPLVPRIAEATCSMVPTSD
jgi:hypothetical protein